MSSSIGAQTGTVSEWWISRGLLRIRYTLVAAAQIIYESIKMKMSFIQRQDVSKHWKALNYLFCEITLLTGFNFLTHLILQRYSFRSWYKMRYNDDLCKFKPLARSWRTDWFIVSPLCTVLDDFGSWVFVCNRIFNFFHLI